jgi:hypothetical protein
MMEPPIAALLGATVGTLAGLAGPLVSSSIQAARDRAKWRLDNQRDAYVNVLQHLSSAMNLPPDTTPGDMTAELARAQAAVGTVMIFCNESQREHLAKALEQIDATMKVTGSAPALAELYESIVECARRDFHHR